MVVLALGDRIQTALLNTVLGMVIVFIVLIIISFFIYLLRFIPKLVQRGNDNKAKESKLDFNKESIPSKELIKKDQTLNDSKLTLNRSLLNQSNRNERNDNNLVSDTELVSVITAAIMAYIGDEVPVDGLVVRSIRRVNQSNWKR